MAVRRFLHSYRLVLAASLFGACIAYTALAATSPEVATPLGIMLVALVLLFAVLVRIYEGGRR